MDTSWLTAIYVLAQGIVDVENRRSKNVTFVPGNEQFCGDENGGKPIPPSTPQIDRRVMKLAAGGDGHANKRIGDPGRDH
jgi:hypothetical protein